MKPWRSVVTPHRDLRIGQFDESVFAADLSDVVAGRGPLEYRDGATFFHKTYPTRGLLNLLATVLARLAGQRQGDSVIQIQTPFGGGKTHSLIALYHLFSSALCSLPLPDVVLQALDRAGLKSIPQARLVVFVGTASDPLRGKTPWGELAAQLGRYEVLKEHDERRRAPGKERLHQLLSDLPTLILMDEIAEYAVKAKDFQEQLMAFFQELTETVKVLPHCTLVVTLPSSVPYGEEGERTLSQLQRIFGRVEAIYTPVEGVEVYEIIRRRLFEDLGDPKEAQAVVEGYWQLYQRLGEDIPHEAREPGYRERMLRAYPFHPQVIDILYERWGTFPTFQRTRGVLRLLAHVVSDLYRREHPAPLIQVAHLNLGNRHIRQELLKHIGNEYESVITSDIAGPNAKAPRIDREMGSEYARFEVATGLATAIFFGSFSGAERRGVNIAGLRLALLREGIPSAIVGDALNRLEDELWFLHVEGGLYQFRNQPNLNRIIVEQEEAVSDEDIAHEIRKRLERLVGSDMKVYLFPSRSGDIPDTRDLKLAIVSGEYPRGYPTTADFVAELLGRASSAFRTYRNTLCVLVPDEGEFATLKEQVRRFLALRAIQEDRHLKSMLSEEHKRLLESKLKDASDGADFHLLASYRHLAKASADGVQWEDLGLPTTGKQSTLSRRVREFLKTQDQLLEKLTPRRMVEMALGKEEEEKTLGEIYEVFLRYPHLPILDSERVLWEAVKQGVHEGLFGVRAGERLYFKEFVPGEALRPDAVLVRSPKVEQGPIEPPPPTEPPFPPPPPTPTLSHLVLRIRVPWDKMHEIVRGVLMPLHQENAELQVELKIEAQSPSGIKEDTLKYKVFETLQQIGAEVIEKRFSPPLSD